MSSASMSTTIRIEPVTPARVDGLAELFQALQASGDDRHFHPHPLTCEAADRICAHSGKDYYCVVVDDGAVVGYGMLRGWDEGHQTPSLGIAIDPEARAQGRARALMLHLHEQAIRRGARSIRLRVYPDNARALRLYQSLGYRFTREDGPQLLGLLDLHGTSTSETRSMRFYGQWDPPVDKVLFERYFRDVRAGFFIEAGAFDGELESSCKFFEESMNWRGINIEPTPANFERLQHNRPASINLRIALSDSEGTAIFKQAVHPQRGQHFGNGSLRHTPEHLRILQAEGCTFDEFPVRTTTYRSLMAEQAVDRVDLMVLDVEGHEPAVVAGMRGCPVLPKVLCIEHGHGGIDATTALLGPLGYRYDFSSHNNSFYLLP